MPGIEIADSAQELLTSCFRISKAAGGRTDLCSCPFLGVDVRKRTSNPQAEGPEMAEIAGVGWFIEQMILEFRMPLSCNGLKAANFLTH